MEKKKTFEVLGIPTTKEVNIIKNAYRGKLLLVNPEDDPKGFKLLREAYEEAIRFASIEEEGESEGEGGESPHTPIEKWMERVEGVYNKLSSRIKVDCWKELFDEDICTDFDTSSEAEEAFLVFLMENFRLPIEVWELIEDRFQLVDSKEALYEKFPVEFVDYITEDLENKGWMDYTLFEGEDEAEIDEFLRKYLSLRSMNDSNQYEEAEELLETFQEINLWHPYLEVEKIRYFMAHKKCKEAIQIAELLREKNLGDPYVKYYIAELCLETGDLEGAYAECKAILEENPDYFGAKVLLCEWHLKKEDFNAAKEGYIELLEIDSYNEKLLDGMHNANIGLIESFKEQIKREPDNKTVMLELAWCYYQNNLYEECRTLAESIEINDEIYYDYYNLMSRAYLELENYEKGFFCVEKWLAEILKTEEDGSKEARRRYNRLGLAYYSMSSCYYNFQLEKEDEKEALNKCIQYIDLAVEAEQNTSGTLSYLLQKAQVLLELEEYKRCVDICDEIIRTEKTYYPAYLLRQEAYFNLEMAQEVIEDYSNAIEIYSGYVKPYLFAIKVYENYGQYDDVATVISRAKEAGVESKELVFRELKNRRLLASTNKERKEVAEELNRLFENVQLEQGDLVEPSALLYEQALCYENMKEYELSLAVIEKNLKINKSNESLILKADIFYELEKYEECIAIQKELLKENAHYSYGLYMKGLCYNSLGNEQEAIKSFLKLLKISPRHDCANDRLCEIYKKRYVKDYKKEDYELALKYAKKQVKVNPHSYYYTNLGLVYLEAYDMKNAIEAFEKAIEYDDSSMYPYNNLGYVYKILGELDKAYEYYKLAIERTNSEDMTAYWNIASYYRATGRYEEAIETFEVIGTKGNHALLANKKIVYVYEQRKDWEQALEQVRKLQELGEDGEKFYLLTSGDLYVFMGNYEKALELYKLGKKKFSKKSSPYMRMGDYLLCISGDKKKALRYYKKAYKIARKHDSKEEKYALQSIVCTLKELGKHKKGIPYVEKLYNIYKSKYGSVENYLNNPEYRKLRLFSIAVCNFNIGQYEKGQHYMELMKDTLNCAKCQHGACYEYMELEATLQELKKDYRGALENYQRAYEIAPDNIYYIYKIKEMKEKAEAEAETRVL